MQNLSLTTVKLRHKETQSLNLSGFAETHLANVYSGNWVEWSHFQTVFQHS